MDKSKGIEKMCWILDFSGNFPSKVTRQIMGSVQSLLKEDKLHKIVSMFYRIIIQVSSFLLFVMSTERLGECFIINAPWFFSVLYTILTPFIHGNTRKKIHCKFSL